MPLRGRIAPQELRRRVGDLRQFAGVRRIVLEDGPERGVRALAFSTGGGLDFWVLTDRSFDIGPLWWRGMPVAWQSPAGFRAPDLTDLENDGARGFNRSFSGFLVTCGLDHIRQPADGQPLHGRFPYTPGRLLAYGEDWDADEAFLYCQGEVVQWRYGGETLRLRRRIEAPVGAGTIRVLDTVENIGPDPARPAVLYHFNLGFPAIATGTTIDLDETRVAGPLTVPEAGPVAAVVHASAAPRTALCRVLTPSTGGTKREIQFRWRSDTLPYLQLWRDLRPYCGVLSVEPCSVGRMADGANEPAEPLGPGEQKSFILEVALDEGVQQSEPASATTLRK